MWCNCRTTETVTCRLNTSNGIWGMGLYTVSTYEAKDPCPQQKQQQPEEPLHAGQEPAKTSKEDPWWELHCSQVLLYCACKTFASRVPGTTACVLLPLLERWKMNVMQLLYGCTTTHHTLFNPPNTHAYTFFYICHFLNIQQFRNTPCRGPGAYSVNVWGQRASARAHNRSNNNPPKPYMQTKNLQRHLKKIHGENYTVHKFYCIVIASRIPGTTACAFAIC